MDTKKILFRIGSAKIEQFALFEENYNSTEESTKYDNKINFEASKRDHSIKCLTTITATQKEKAVFKIALGIVFKLSPESWETLSKGSKIDIPHGFSSYMAQTCYGCIRGALLVKLENTEIKNMLPAADFNQIIKGDIELDIDTPEKQ